MPSCPSPLSFERLFFSGLFRSLDLHLWASYPARARRKVSGLTKHCHTFSTFHAILTVFLLSLLGLDFALCAPCCRNRFLSFLLHKCFFLTFISLTKSKQHAQYQQKQGTSDKHVVVYKTKLKELMALYNTQLTRWTVYLVCAVYKMNRQTIWVCAIWSTCTVIINCALLVSINQHLQKVTVNSRLAFSPFSKICPLTHLQMFIW